jgi:hypothetical protein
LNFLYPSELPAAMMPPWCNTNWLQVVALQVLTPTGPSTAIPESTGWELNSVLRGALPESRPDFCCSCGLVKLVAKLQRPFEQ